MLCLSSFPFIDLYFLRFGPCSAQRKRHITFQPRVVKRASRPHLSACQQGGVLLLFLLPSIVQIPGIFPLCLPPPYWVAPFHRRWRGVLLFLLLSQTLFYHSIHQRVPLTPRGATFLPSSREVFFPCTTAILAVSVISSLSRYEAKRRARNGNLLKQASPPAIPHFAI